MADASRFLRLRDWLVAHPAHGVLAALFALWFGLFLSLPHEKRDAASGQNKYEPIMARGDGHYIYLNMLSIVFDRDIELTNEYKRFGDPFNNTVTRFPSGYCWIYPIGSAVLQAPFFLVGHATAKVANVFGAGIPEHGYTRWHQRFTFAGAMFAGFASIVFAWRLARRHVSTTAATWAAVIAALGTPLLFYGVYWVSYNHAWTALAVAWLLDYWDGSRGRSDLRRWLALGALVGLCGLTRQQEVAFALAPAIEWAVLFVRRPGERGRLLVAAGAATLMALLVISPQLYANWRVFGGAFEVGQPYFMRWSSPFWWEPLFATRNGLFVWTPLAYLGVLGLFAARQVDRPLAGVLLLGFAVQVYVNGSAWAWWSDWSFSARRFVNCTPLFLVGLAFLLERGRELHARFPRLAPHVAVGLAVLPLLVMNLELSRAVARSKQRVGQPVETRKLYGDSLGRLVDGVSSSVGAPTTWPASWVWGLAHGISPGRFEDLVGHERLFVSNLELHKKGSVDRIELNKATLAQYGLNGWELGKLEGREVAIGRDGARLALPLFLDEGVSLVVTGQPGEGAELSFGGETFPLVAGETRIDPAPLEVGTNVLTFHCPTDPCVSLSQLQLVYTP